MAYEQNKIKNIPHLSIADLMQDAFNKSPYKTRQELYNEFAQKAGIKPPSAKTLIGAVFSKGRIYGQVSQKYVAPKVAEKNIERLEIVLHMMGVKGNSPLVKAIQEIEPQFYKKRKSYK